MPIPRFKDKATGVPFDLSLSCKCGWAIIKDHLTMNIVRCPLCGNEKLETVRNDYIAKGADKLERR
jgi:hypothetical protein